MENAGRRQGAENEEKGSTHHFPYRNVTAIFARQNDNRSGRKVLPCVSPPMLRKYRNSQLRPTRSLRNPVAPPPMSTAGSVRNTGKAPCRPSFFTCINPIPPTK